MQGQKLMMMGTADEIVKAPEKGPIFAEDMPEEELVIHVVINLYNKLLEICLLEKVCSFYEDLQVC